MHEIISARTVAESTIEVTYADGAVAYVPVDPAVAHYRAVQVWVSEGGEIAPLTLPVPASVSRFQAQAVLHLYGLLPQVQAIMADSETDTLVKLAWESVQEFRRDSPMMLELGDALGLSSEQLDAMFIAAAEIAA